MEETTFGTILIRLALVISYISIPLYIMYQITLWLREGLISERSVELLCHFAWTSLWFTIGYIVVDIDLGLHAHAHYDAMPGAGKVLVWTLQEVRSITEPCILGLGALLCIVAVIKALQSAEFAVGEEPIVDEEPVVDEEPAVDEEPVVDGEEGEAAALEEIVWMFVNAPQLFVWRFRDIGLLLLDLVEDWVLDALDAIELAAPVLKSNTD